MDVLSNIIDLLLLLYNNSLLVLSKRTTVAQIDSNERSCLYEKRDNIKMGRDHSCPALAWRIFQPGRYN